MVGRWIAWLVGCLVAWWLGCLVGGLVGWSVGWLVVERLGFWLWQPTVLFLWGLQSFLGEYPFGRTLFGNFEEVRFDVCLSNTFSFDFGLFSLLLFALFESMKKIDPKKRGSQTICVF